MVADDWERITSVKKLVGRMLADHLGCNSGSYGLFS